MDIATKFKQLRIGNNLSANKVGKDLGIDPSTLTKIEKGNSLPSLKLLISYCDYFNISLSDFFNDSDNIFIPEHFKKFFEENQGLTSEQLEQLNNFLRTLY